MAIFNTSFGGHSIVCELLYKLGTRGDHWSGS